MRSLNTITIDQRAKGTPEEQERSRKAALKVCDLAKDPAEAQELLSMLGLISPEDES